MVVVTTPYTVGGVNFLTSTLSSAKQYQAPSKCELKMKKAKTHKVSKLFITIKWNDDPFR